MFFSFLAPKADDAVQEEAQLKQVKKGNRSTATMLPIKSITYTDAENRYAFDYPVGWFAQSNPWQIDLETYVPAVTVYSHNPFEPIPGSEMPQQGVIKIDFIPSAANEGQTIQQFLSEIRQAERQGGTEIDSEEWFFLPGGLLAVQVTLRTPFGSAFTMFTTLHGRGMRVVGFGDQSLFAGVAHTLRAL